MKSKNQKKISYVLILLSIFAITFVLLMCDDFQVLVFGQSLTLVRMSKVVFQTEERPCIFVIENAWSANRG